MSFFIKWSIICLRLHQSLIFNDFNKNLNDNETRLCTLAFSCYDRICLHHVSCTSSLAVIATASQVWNFQTKFCSEQRSSVVQIPADLHSFTSWNIWNGVPGYLIYDRGSQTLFCLWGRKSFCWLPGRLVQPCEFKRRCRAFLLPFGQSHVTCVPSISSLCAKLN